jgi:hypothetical protein
MKSVLQKSSHTRHANANIGLQPHLTRPPRARRDGRFSRGTQPAKSGAFRGTHHCTEPLHLPFPGRAGCAYFSCDPELALAPSYHPPAPRRVDPLHSQAMGTPDSGLSRAPAPPAAAEIVSRCFLCIFHLTRDARVRRVPRSQQDDLLSLTRSWVFYSDTTGLLAYANQSETH